MVLPSLVTPTTQVENVCLCAHCLFWIYCTVCVCSTHTCGVCQGLVLCVRRSCFFEITHDRTPFVDTHSPPPHLQSELLGMKADNERGVLATELLISHADEIFEGAQPVAPGDASSSPTRSLEAAVDRLHVASHQSHTPCFLWKECQRGQDPHRRSALRLLSNKAIGDEGSGVQYQSTDRGLLIEIWEPNDGAWLRAEVTSFDEDNKKHNVILPDLDEREHVVDLRFARIRAATTSQAQ